MEGKNEGLSLEKQQIDAMETGVKAEASLDERQEKFDLQEQLEQSKGKILSMAEHIMKVCQDNAQEVYNTLAENQKELAVDLDHFKEFLPKAD